MPLDRTWLNAQVDDSGSGMDGSILDKADFIAIYDAIDAALAVSTTPGITTDGTRVQQIAFAATQFASSDANTLDDYEEGGFTPTIASSGGGTPTYTTQNGRYIKIGRFVFFGIYLALATKGTLGAGNVTISGLPFTPTSAAANGWGVSIGTWSAMTTAVVHMSATASPGAAQLQMYHATAAATGTSLTQVSDIGSTVALTIAGCYETSA